MPLAPLGSLAGQLDQAIGTLAERLRRRPSRWWSADSACDGWTRADVVAHLVAGYAATEHLVRGAPPRTPVRPSRDDVLVNQLVVCGRDLVTTLRGCPPGHRVGDVAVEWIAARELAETLVHGWDADGISPDARPAEAALGWLAPARTAAAGFEPGSGAWSDLLLLVTGRGANAGPCSWEPPAS